MLASALLSITLCGCGEDSFDGLRDRIEKRFPKRPKESVDEEEKGKYEDYHLKISVTGKGYDIFTPGKGISYDYRYGPSMIYDDDGGIDAWFASPADGTEFDWITYRHSDDGGRNWSDEKVVLSPDPGSRDTLSVCDPDVFYYNGYYYMGYTSTMDSTGQGLVNSVFLARSIRPDGPFEKWNGDGWGGEPEPIIYYDGVWIGWGVGEPSFVVLDDTLYIYITRDSYTADNDRVRSTEVWTSDLAEDDWMSSLVFAGYAIIRTDGTDDDGYNYDDCDSWDVAYVEEAEKFVAVCTNRRMKDDSCLLYFESNNGIHFERVSELNTNVYCGSHNAGIMGDGQGHIKSGDPMLVGYAYSGSENDVWGTWATRFAPISIDIAEEADRDEDGKENLKEPIEFRARLSEPFPIFINTYSVVNYATAEGGTYNIDYRWMDSDKGSHWVSASEITFTGYDRDVVEVEDGKITTLSSGSTLMTISYEGLSRKLRFYSLSRGVSANDVSTGSVEEIISPIGEYTMSLSIPYAVCIRPILRFKNYSMEELNVEGLLAHDVNFESADEAICEVRADGLLTPVSPGETKVTVSCGGLRYKVDVTVVE